MKVIDKHCICIRNYAGITFITAEKEWKEFKVTYYTEPSFSLNVKFEYIFQQLKISKLTKIVGYSSISNTYTSKDLAMRGKETWQ